VDKVLKSLNDLSLTITTGGETTPVAVAGVEGDAAVKAEPAESAAPVQTKTINVNVELIKFGAKKSASTTGANASAGDDGNAAGGAQNGGEAGTVSVGDVGGARIETVDTTTV